MTNRKQNLFWILLILFNIALLISHFVYLNNSENDYIAAKNDNEEEIVANDDVETSYRTVIQNLNFRTIDRYKESGGESRVAQKGENGVIKMKMKVTSNKNGVELDRKMISNIIEKEPIDEIIERVVAVENKKYTGSDNIHHANEDGVITKQEYSIEYVDTSVDSDTQEKQALIFDNKDEMINKFREMNKTYVEGKSTLLPITGEGPKMTVIGGKASDIENNSDNNQYNYEWRY